MGKIWVGGKPAAKSAEKSLFIYALTPTAIVDFVMMGHRFESCKRHHFSLTAEYRHFLATPFISAENF